MALLHETPRTELHGVSFMTKKEEMIINEILSDLDFITIATHYGACDVIHYGNLAQRLKNKYKKMLEKIKNGENI